MQVQLQSSVWTNPLLHSALTDKRICSAVTEIVDVLFFPSTFSDFLWEVFMVTSAGWLAKSNVQSLELINCLYRRKLRLKRKVSGCSHFDIKCSLIIVGWFFFSVSLKLFFYWAPQGKMNASQFDSEKCSMVQLKTNHLSLTQQLSLHRRFFCFFVTRFIFDILQCQLNYLPVTHKSETTKQKRPLKWRNGFTPLQLMCCTL